MPLLLAGVVAGGSPLTAAVAQARPSGPAASRTIIGGLTGVAATSASNAWAVGDTRSGALIERWNGKTWKPVPSQAPAGSVLSGVAAVSAGNAWAVGSSGRGRTLILRWNGRSWKQVPNPSPAKAAGLSGVAAVSARSAWAVGCRACDGGPNLALIEHWNGTASRRVPSPSPGGAYLAGWPPSPPAPPGPLASPAKAP